MKIEAKKKKDKKYTKKDIREVHDLSERMMAAGHVPEEITNPYSLSWWMKGRGYNVKEKPSKPHAHVKPFEKKKKKKSKKKSEIVEGLCKIANVLDKMGLYEDADRITSILEKVAQDNEDISEGEMDLEPDTRDCPTRGGPGMFLGDLGNRRHYRCRNCGIDFSKEDKTASSDNFNKLAEGSKKKFTDEEVRRIGEEIGIDFDKYDFEEFKRGLEVELEHGKEDKQTNVTDDDDKMTGQIAFRHMKEAPSGTYDDKDDKPGYYELLDKLEEKLKKSEKNNA